GHSDLGRIFEIEIRQQMKTIKRYLSLVKFSHTIFALPFAMIGFFLAVWWLPGQGGEHLSAFPEYDPANSADNQSLAAKFVLVLVCMVFARSAAMAFNRWLDKNFDAKNPRTAIREI